MYIICMYVYMYIYICITYMKHIYKHSHTHTHIYIYMYVYIYMYMLYVYIYVYVYMCIYMFTYVYIIYIYIYYILFFKTWALCLFLQPTFFFHVNALNGEINLHFFKMLWKKEIKFSNHWKKWLLCISINWPITLVNGAYYTCSLISHKIRKT